MLNNFIKKSASRLRRTMLYVPASDQRKIDKIHKLNADSYCFDLEDAVSVQQKITARQNIQKYIQSPPNIDYLVRINSYKSQHFEDDIQFLLDQNLQNIQIVLPKIESSEEIKIIYQKLKNLNVRLTLIIETLQAFLNLQDICQTGKDLQILDGLIFGADDFAAELGAIRSIDSKEVLYARQKMVLYGKAFKLKCIDMVNKFKKVNIEFENLDKLKKEADEGYQFGFTGKQIIHPNQIEIVQKSFLPSTNDIAWAKEIKKSYENQEKGAYSLDLGKKIMIDAPTYKQALNILNQLK